MLLSRFLIFEILLTFVWKFSFLSLVASSRAFVDVFLLDNNKWEYWRYWLALLYGATLCGAWRRREGSRTTARIRSRCRRAKQTVARNAASSGVWAWTCSGRTSAAHSRSWHRGTRCFRVNIPFSTSIFCSSWARFESRTSLAEAAQRHSAKVVGLLLFRGANVHATDHDG